MTEFIGIVALLAASAVGILAVIRGKQYPYK